MNKLTLLALMFPLAACVTPDRLAQWKADRAAQVAKVAQAEPACASKGLSPRSDAYLWCVNNQLHKDGLEVVRRDGNVALRATELGDFASSETSMGARTPSGSIPPAVPVAAPMGR
jgi:hypothetical protein